MAGFIDALLILGCLFFCIPAFYLAFLTFFSAELPIPPSPEARLKFDIIVPSHNEENGIARTVENLLKVGWPQELFHVVVVADNCNDSTAAKARQAGAIVLERQSVDLRGKGYALDHAFKWSLEKGFADAVVVVDADTVVSANLLEAFATRLEAGSLAAQAHYGVLEENSTWRTRLMRIAFALFHTLRSSARERLGLSCGLRGNGMCFSKHLIQQIPHDAFSVVEDVEYGIRLGRAGHRIAYAHEAFVLGEMVSGEKASRSQRRRWEGGRLQLMKQYGLPLLSEGFAKGDAMLLDLALDVLVPPLSWVVLGVGGLWFFSTLGSIASGYMWASWTLSSLALIGLAFYLARGIVIAKVGAQGLIDLAYAPVYMAWKLWLAIKGDDKKGEWVRTERESESKKTETPGP